MSDLSETGVLYTDQSRLAAATPIASLWSFESRARGAARQSVALNADGSHEYWLQHSDPLLNTILPGTGVSLVVNFGDPWAAGRSLTTSELLPRLSVVGPVTQSRILRVGRSVHAVGAVFVATLTPAVFNMPATELVDRIVALEDLWGREDAERFYELLSSVRQKSGRTFHGVRLKPDATLSVSAMRDALVARIRGPHSLDAVGRTAQRLITFHAGRVSIDDVARSHGLSRQQFARRFCGATGLPPKLFARITRFQALVQTLLSTDVSQWASVSPAVGFYDQAHMINEFRAFAGAPPTTFFRPHDASIDPARIQLRGRPSEWVRDPGSGIRDPGSERPVTKDQ